MQILSPDFMLITQSQKMTVYGPIEFPIYIVNTEDMVELQREDPFCRDMLKRLKSNKQPQSKFVIQDNILMYNKTGDHKIVLPKVMQTDALVEAQDQPMSGHLGIEGTLFKLKKIVYWPKMKKHTYQYVTRCQECQRGKRPIRNPQGLMQSIAVPDQPHSFISIHFARPLPTTKELNK